jgi:hypothetical protein
MPKEVTYDDANMYDVVVGWEADKYVQVGIETHGGQPVVKMLGGGGEEPKPLHDMATFTGLWGTFDRTGVNRLIRSLRRARDQAYGRDE